MLLLLSSHLCHDRVEQLRREPVLVRAALASCTVALRSTAARIVARLQHLLLPWAPDGLLASGGSGGGSDGSGGPGDAPLDISGSVLLLLERVFILLCSQLFGIEVREEVSDVLER